MALARSKVKLTRPKFGFDGLPHDRDIAHFRHHQRVVSELVRDVMGGGDRKAPKVHGRPHEVGQGKLIITELIGDGDELFCLLVCPSLGRETRCVRCDAVSHFQG